MVASAKSSPTIETRNHYISNVYFQDGLKVTITLCVLLYLVLATSLDAAGHVREGLSILLPVTLGSLLLSTLMSFSRFDSFFAFSHSMFTGLAWILLLMALQVDSKQKDLVAILDRGIPDLQARSYFVLLRLLNWLDAAISDKASADNLVFIFEISLLVWWLAYLGMWAIVRHGYTWRAVIPAGVVLVINTHYAPKPVYSFLFIFALLGLVLLVRTNLAEKQRIWREQRIYFSQDITLDFMRNGFIYALVVLALAMIVPNVGRVPFVRDALVPITDRWMQTQQKVAKYYEGMNRRSSSGAQAGFGNQFNLGGERNVGDTWLFTVQAIQPRYWRAVVYDEYTGLGWRNSSEITHQFDADQLIPVPGWSARHEISQTINVLAAVGTTVIGAPDIRSASIPLNTTIGSAPAAPFMGIGLNDETETGAAELTLIRTIRDLDVGDHYTIYSNETDATIQDLREAGVDYPQSILDKYLQLPENFSPEIRELAKTTVEGMLTPYDKAKAIETYLRTLEYDETIAGPGPNVDPLEYFLFDVRKGYCDYYASSMVTMLRAEGVPARAASGYAVGFWDEESGDYFVSERDAHTWVEVFFPEYGWIEFEPTAAEPPLNRPEANVDVETTVGDNNPGQNNNAESEPTFDPFQQFNELQSDQEPAEMPTQATNYSLLPWWAWLLLTPPLLILGLWLLWRMQTSAPSAFTTEVSPILYERMQRWAERLHLAPLANDTPFEQERRLAKALPQIKQPIHVVTESFVLHQFAPQNGAFRDGAARDGIIGNAVPGTTTTNIPSEETDLMNAWRALLPVFLKKWAAQWLPWQDKSSLAAGKVNANGVNRNGKNHFNIDEEIHRVKTLRKPGLARGKTRKRD